MEKSTILIRLLEQVDESARNRIRRHGDLSTIIAQATVDLNPDHAQAVHQVIYRPPASGKRRFATPTTVSLDRSTLERLDQLKDDTGYYRNELINIALSMHLEAAERKDAAAARAVKASAKRSG